MGRRRVQEKHSHLVEGKASYTTNNGRFIQGVKFSEEQYRLIGYMNLTAIIMGFVMGVVILGIIIWIMK